MEPQELMMRVQGPLFQILGKNGFAIMQCEFSDNAGARLFAEWVTSVKEIDWAAYEGTLYVFPHDKNYPQEWRLNFKNEEDRCDAYGVLAKIAGWNSEGWSFKDDDMYEATTPILGKAGRLN